MKYTKPAITHKEQIRKLTSRGLIINDATYAEHQLQHINYYRLTGYWWSFQSDRVHHIFKPNSKFETVIKVYNFDCELRTLLFDTIAQIEVSFRCKLAYHLSHEFDPWWFEKSVLFMDSREHFNCLKTIDRELGHSSNNISSLEQRTSLEG